MGITFQVVEGLVPASTKKVGNKSSKYDEVMLAIAGLGDNQHLAVGKESVDEAEKFGHAIRTQINKAGLKDLTVGQRNNIIYIQKKAVAAA